MECIPPAPDRTGLSQRGLGVWDVLIGQAIEVGGAVGAAAISANAQKYAVKRQVQAELQVALARQQAELAMAQAQMEAARLAQEQVTERSRARTEAATKVAQSAVGPAMAVVGLLGVTWLAVKIVKD